MRIADAPTIAVSNPRDLALARAIAFDLRCDVREALLKYIREEMPEAIPRNRLLMAADPAGGMGSRPA